MKPGNNLRQHLTETAALLSALVIAVAAIQFVRMDTEVIQQREQLQAMSRGQEEYFRGEYLEIAAQIDISVSDLQDALTNIANTPSFLKGEELADFRVCTNRFELWLERQLKRPLEERIENEKLRERMAADRFSSPRGPQGDGMNLADILKQLKEVYGVYLAAASKVIANAGSHAQKTISSELAKAGQAAQDLLDLADKARRNADAIKRFLETQPPPGSKRSLAHYYLLAALLFPIAFLVVVFRSSATGQLHVELAKRDLVLEHQQQLAHFGQLAAGLAHEIRNPLTAISARLYVLQKALAEGSPEHRDSMVIRDEMHRLDRIVQDFLTLARPATPKLAAMSADPLLSKLRDLLAPLYAARSIELKLDAVEPAPFRADEAQLKQVLINLVRNAAESMEGQGTITLRARKDRLRLRAKTSDVIAIEVEDTGTGIQPEVADRLFIPFFSTKEGGTGLGLAIAARIVNQHGGELTFETRLDHGTTFKILLPLSEKTA